MPGSYRLFAPLIALKASPRRADISDVRAQSWQVQLAAVLVAISGILGVVLVVGAFRLMGSDPGFLFAILPVVVLVVSVVGVNLAAYAGLLAVRLWRVKPGARLQVGLFGACLMFAGVVVAAASPAACLVLVPYGGALLWLMTTEGAARDLGGWTRNLRQPAPWGSTPGNGLWSPEPQQHGPWAPNPTKLPWLSWKGASGPRTPWWQTWKAGLAQGIPAWELVVLGIALVLFIFGLLALPSVPRATLGIRLGDAQPPAWPILFVPASLAAVWWLERRMRRRLADER